MVRIPHMLAKNNIQVSLTWQKPQLSSHCQYMRGSGGGGGCKLSHCIAQSEETPLCRHRATPGPRLCNVLWRSSIKYHPLPGIQRWLPVTISRDLSPPSRGLSSDSYWYWSQYKTGNLLATKQIRKCNILDNWFTSYLPHRLLSILSKENGRKSMLGQ